MLMSFATNKKFEKEAWSNEREDADMITTGQSPMQQNVNIYTFQRLF